MFGNKSALLSADFIEAPSAWLGHIPFAFWLVEALKPKTLVELGTHHGHSYFAFCKSVHQNGLNAKCYAVDTWQGDEHAGQYGEDIFQTVNAHNDRLYAAFSRLLRTTFDDAVNYFTDGTVDLLHIDGLHTYEAVRHDFETWLPKMSQAGVILFHDTNVRERGFGVWRLWEELTLEYRNLEFQHSHGLGVLFIGNGYPPEIERFLEYCATLDGQYLARSFFSKLGDSIGMERQLYLLNKLVGGLREELTHSKQNVDRTNGELLTAKSELMTARSQLEHFRCSTSWKVTKPLRVIRQAIKGGGGHDAS